MAFDIQIIKNNLIYLTFFEETDFQENLIARNEVVRINKEVGLYKVLTNWKNASIAESVSSFDFNHFGKTWPLTIENHPFVVAVVLSKINTDTHFGIDFSNTVAKSRGLISRLFWNDSEAESWLGYFNDSSCII